MSRRRDLQPFCAWLETHGYSAGTINVYASSIRLLRAHVMDGLDPGSPITPEALTGVIVRVNPNRRSTIKAAWRALREFSETVLGEPLPDFAVTERAYTLRAAPSAPGATSEPAETPPAMNAAAAGIGDAIHMLSASAGIDARDLPRATWALVRELPNMPGFARVSHPDPEEPFGICSLERLKPLRAWAGAGGEPRADQPLVPTVAGGKTPLPTKELRQILASHTQALRPAGEPAR